MSIRLSKKHGFNPSLCRCIVCGEEYGVALFGTSYKDPKTGKGNAEAPREIFQGLCERCDDIITSGGTFFIEVTDDSPEKNPYRTGRIVGLTKEFKEKNNITAPINYMRQSDYSKMFNEALTEYNETDKAE